MSSVDDQVLKWLRGSGYPLEMEAASAFREAGFEVHQSTTYADLSTQKGREVDVLARDPDIWGFIALSVVVECKSSSKPWVVLFANDAKASRFVLRDFAVMTGAVMSALLTRGFATLALREFLHQERACGYGLRQAMSKEFDPAYGASVNLLSACNSLLSQQIHGEWEPLGASVPVLVVDSPIFECRLGPDGSLQLQQVDESAFTAEAHVPTLVSSVIHVVSRQRVRQAALRLKAAMNALRSDLRLAEEKIMDRLSIPADARRP